MESERTMTKKRSALRPSSGRGAKLYRWNLDDEAFFRRFEELNDEQRRFYVAMRQRGRTAHVLEKWTAKMAGPECAEAVKGVQVLLDLGIIVREIPPAAAGKACAAMGGKRSHVL